MDDTLLVPAAIVVMLVLSLVSVKNVWYDCVDYQLDVHLWSIIETIVGATFIITHRSASFMS